MSDSLIAFQPAIDEPSKNTPHHSNYVPWHFLREKKGAIIKFAECNSNGEVEIVEIKKLILIIDSNPDQKAATYHLTKNT